jgi:hypothetical protein
MADEAFVEYIETGGLRWGHDYANGANATWPFAQLRITPVGLEIDLNLWPFLVRHFEFSKAQVKAIIKKRALFSVGVQIEHLRSDYPPFILFWSFHRRQLLEAAVAAGFRISN